MSQSLINDLLGQLQGAPLQGMAAQLGADTETTSNAIAAALPMLVGAMSANAQRPGGADSLLGALQRDHSGAGALDMGSLLGGLLGGGQQGGGAGAAILGSLLGGGGRQGGAGAGALGSILGSVLGNAGAPKSRQLDAGGILGNIFGKSRASAEAGLEQTTGLNKQQSSTLLKLLAPVVMAYLANQVKARHMNANQLGQALSAETARASAQGGTGGMFAGMFDQNGDGQLDASDLLQVGMKMLAGRR
ncbi:MAG: DUF937 domain-containing protein [Ottowia sp.]|nr:DUF937 domain-containing protein [Ottowia sp.]MBQ9578512.1 DUF937 domain-containing protein [Ottowia sp.]